MSTFTLDISCLTTPNLPWFMDLTFQVPMQYCSLQHQTLLLSPVTSIAGYCFCFGSIPSFFLELFLHWSPVVCWAPTDLGSSSFSVLSFCLFILFMGFSRIEYWNGLPWKQTTIFLSFWRLPPSTAFQTLVDYEAFSISSKGFLPTVVDIMVIWVKLTIPVHFS